MKFIQDDDKSAPELHCSTPDSCALSQEVSCTYALTASLHSETMVSPTLQDTKSLHFESQRRWRSALSERPRLHVIHEHMVTDVEPQDGMENLTFTIELLRTLAKFGDYSLPPNLLKEVEGLACLYGVLRDTTTTTQLVSAVLLYMRGHYSDAIIVTVRDYIAEIFKPGPIEMQLGEEEEHPQWINILRKAQDNWKACKGSTAFSQLSKLLGVIVTLGLCNASSLSFTIGGFKLFAQELTAKHMSAVDMADAVFTTVTYFVEGAYMSFKAGSIAPLFTNDRAALELDAKFARMLSMWGLLQNGNLFKVMQVEDSEFDSMLKDLTEDLRILLGTLKGFDKKMVSDKYAKCLMIRCDYVTRKLSSGIRRAPFAIEFFGESSQGKTTIGDQITDALLTSQGLSIDKKYRATLNPGDKFMSTWTTDKLVMVLDDVSNEKAMFVEKAPTRAVLDIVNNAMMYATKADLESKGRCFVEPEIVILNTNIEHLDAGTYMNCPYATQRRMDLVITVQAKPEFQRIVNGRTCGIDSSKIHASYMVNGVYSPPVIDDIWNLTVKRAVKPEKASTVAKYEVQEFRGVPMENVSTSLVIQMCVEKFDEHRKNQRKIVANMERRQGAMKVCGVDGCIHIQDHCDKHKHTGFIPHFGVESVVARLGATNTCNAVISSYNNLNFMNTTDLYALASQHALRWDWLCCLPVSVLDNKYFGWFAIWFWSDLFKSHWRKTTFTIWMFGLMLWALFPSLGPFILLFCFYQQFYAMSSAKDRMMEVLRERNDSISPMIKSVRDARIKHICGGVAAIGFLYSVAKLYRTWMELREPHGSLDPKSKEEIDARDKEENLWVSPVLRHLPISEKSSCTSLQAVKNVVDTNLTYARIFTPEGVMCASCLFLTSNVVVLPFHYFDMLKKAELDITFHKEQPDKNGGKFSAKINFSASERVPGTDLCICYVSKGGSFKSILHHFPLSNMPNHNFDILWRAKAGELHTASGFYETNDKTGNGLHNFPGGMYHNLTNSGKPVNTFKGMCGAVLISQTKGSVISGLHLGGVTGTPVGCSGYLSQSMIADALQKLKQVEGVLLTGSILKFEPQMMGVEVLTGKPLHPKSPLNYFPGDSQLQYHGSCVGAVTTYTDVKETPMSPHVETVCGVPNSWGAPKHAPQWWAWQKCGASMSIPGSSFSHDLLMLAVKDYKEPLLAKLREPYWAGMKPLNDEENLCGIPGVKFVDGIKLSTSIGYPLTGAKRSFIVELPPTKEKPNNIVFQDVIMEEIERNLDLYKQGYRAFTISKACKKDEVLSNKKDKCRIFYGNPIAQTFLIRKYFLPLVRFMQMNPLVAECAVGINSHGPELEEMHQHIMQHGDDSIFGGDYGKYDQKLPSQLLLASFRILIDFAKMCDYSAEDIVVMEAMAGDVVFALIAFNGDLISLTEGTHISGNSLTVILNGVCGSLNLRCFFYTLYPSTLKFREVASMITYGDDNMGTVSKHYPNFNIKDFSKFLDGYGQTYTMPDKDSELQPYLDPGTFEFLKRSSVYHEELGVHVGALDDSSIFKSLHNCMRGKNEVNCMEVACALNIDGALREWFNHGEETYEKRRLQMVTVASLSNLTHLCTGLTDTYQIRAQRWKKDYTYLPSPTGKS
jgi:hypothetical protein